MVHPHVEVGLSGSPEHWDRSVVPAAAASGALKGGYLLVIGWRSCPIWGADTVVQLPTVLEVSMMILFLIVVVLLVALAARLFRGLFFGVFGWGHPMWGGGWFGGPGMWGSWGRSWGWGGPGPRDDGMRPGHGVPGPDGRGGFGAPRDGGGHGDRGGGPR